MLRKTVDIRDAQQQLAELLEQADAGTEVILTDGQQHRARLVPIPPISTRRVSGLHAGSMIASADFDTPLPDDFWTGA